MTVKSIAGSQFTVSAGATDYSAQVLAGTITTTPSVSRRKTLGGTSYKQTDIADAVTIDFLYDEEDGFYGAINTAARAGTSLAVVIVGGDAKWTGSLFCDGLEVKYEAEGEGEASASFVGALTLADNP